MKLLNKKQRNNGGFSLVELIVVIAIMVVLVAVLAPVFTRYIESSRRATDVQNANSIAEAVLADVADGKTAATTRTEVTGDNTAVPTGVQGKSTLYVKGSAKTSDTDHFWYQYNADSNTCAVYISETDNRDLTQELQAQKYKDKDPN